jgi:hypothetical protein
MKTIDRTEFKDAWLNSDLTTKELKSFFKCSHPVLVKISKELSLPARKKGRKRINLEG